MLSTLLLDSLADPGYGFSVGGMGAIAEFQDRQIEVTRSGTAVLASSPNGALAVRPRGSEAIIAYETLSAREDAWQHGVSIIAAAGDATMGRRNRLSELGPDGDAVASAHRVGLLFDLGAGMPHIDFCIRTEDPALVALLRRHLGERVVVNRHVVMEAIIDASPTRVVRSAIARIEVYQRIDRHKTPQGPHTHLLPDLAAGGRSHSANLPLPADMHPVLNLHPPNPLVDALGERRPFHHGAFDAFQALLKQFGDERYVDEKRRVLNAVSNGSDPESLAAPGSRAARLARRIALRQLSHLLPDPAPLARWRSTRRA